ncbi:ferritin-like domain-containing protein [Rhexocercosporidium sp. MPI-PUGE-AT-0058]|nr:ferritin-like domain-containing protein [Rhexocercosporidium sp. MPI-PUGE-AT-0058]
MKYAFSIAALAAVATAGPVVTERQTAAAVTDVGILNYALTLEHLEDKFYREGLANYTEADFAEAGFDSTFYNNLKEISYDENTHVSFLSTALADAAVAECTYSFPSTDPASFVALASVLEGVGVSAYLGAAARSPTQRLRSLCSQAIPFPQPFDAPLTFDEVYTLAAGFIVSCPDSNAAKPQLPLKAFPTVTLGTIGPIKSGDTIDLLTPGYTLAPKDGSAPIYAAFVSVTGPIYADVTPMDGGFKVVVPKGVNGQSYVVLTGCKDRVTDETVAAGPAIVEITNPYPSTA